MGEPEPTALFEARDIFLHRAPLAQSTGTGAEPAIAAEHGPDPQDLEACAALLSSVPANPRLQEALALASPSLDALVRRVAERGPAGIRPGQLRRAALAVLRYDIRMRTRPTPFGLFAGVSVGRFDSAAKTERGNDHRTRTHADMQWLTRIGHRLEQDPAVIAGLPVQAHQALVPRGDRLVLASPSTQGVRPGDNGEGRSTVSLRRTPVVERALVEAASPLPYAELVHRTLAAFPGAPLDRVRDLLAELVRQEFLITGLRPPLDGGDPLHHVLGLLAGVDMDAATVETRRIHDGLKAVERERQLYDTQAVGEGSEQLGRLLAAARAVEPDDTPLHIDTRTDSSLHVPHGVRNVIERATTVMWHLSRPKLGLFSLRDFHRRFLDVHGADRLVPILELLDESTGLGPPAGYGWPNSEAAPVPPADPRTATRDRALARLAAAAQRGGHREIVIGDADLAELCHDGVEAPATAPSTGLPNSCEVTVQLVAPRVEALDEGDFLVFLSPSPGSHRAGSTFARFADQHPQWKQEFAALHRDNPVHVQDAVPVDLAFRPRSGRAANLAHTVPATGVRISVGVPNVANGDQGVGAREPGTPGGVEELALSDIGIGATLDRLTAVHLPTGRELVPVLGNMVSAPAQAPNAIRLLWEIGLEGQRLWEPWNWGPLADAPFVPRVRYGRFVLACAVWRLDTLRAMAQELRTRTAEPQAGEWAAAVRTWRSQWDVPNRVLAVTADQRLLLDLDDAWHRELLRDQVLRHHDLIAQEVPGEYEGWLDSPLAGHTSELVVPMVRRDAVAAEAGPTVPAPSVPDTPSAPAPAPAGFSLRRPYAGNRQLARTVHGLGGEWLYLKLYCAARAQDELIRDHLPELVSLAAGLGCDNWFFIRYTDADGHHLRVRLHGTDPRALWGEVAPAVGTLLDRWQRSGLVRGHAVAPYDPEIERYGGPDAQHLAEQVFRFDSEAAVELLRLVKNPVPASEGTARFERLDLDDLAVVSCAALAHAFGPPAPDNPRLADMLADGDPGDDAAVAWLSMTGTRRELPSAFRSRKAHWRRLVDPYDGWTGLAPDPTGARLLAVLDERDRAVRRLADAVRAGGPTPEGRVVGSLLHMVCNRLFGGDSAREMTVLGTARGAVQDHFNRRRHQNS
ncbi:lantibiotic dehydratase [Streptomyces sp. NPDC060020]|uniref:lantibiotic dehydratase n=1 Tax=Streptomyces sp. NPDC060020 TaxID=3347038 RepID=UPI0036CC325D